MWFIHAKFYSREVLVVARKGLLDTLVGLFMRPPCSYPRFWDHGLSQDLAG